MTHEATSATSTIPILFITGTDPRLDGLVESLNRPGRNATGVYLYTNIVIEKCIEQLRDLVPQAGTIVILRLILALRPPSQTPGRTESDNKLTTRTDVKVAVVSVSGQGDFDSAFAARHAKPSGRDDR